MKFIDFMEKRVDPFIKLSLTDLAKTLSEKPDLRFDFSFYSTYKPQSETVTVSHYWSRLLDARKLEGMKSDVYLRAFGNVHFTDYKSVLIFWNEAAQLQHPIFAKQLLSFVEDVRLERLIKKYRPGMRHAFSTRSELFQKRFRDRFSYHSERLELMDSLFCALYLQWAERPVRLPEPLASLKPLLRQTVEKLSNLKDSEESVLLSQALLSALPDEWRDMSESYFMMDPFDSISPQDIPFPGEKNKLVQDRSIEMDQEPDPVSSKEELPTWHADQDQEGDSFLQFDLDEGASSDLLGQGDRRMESGDQAFANLQGKSQQGEGNQYDEQPALEGSNQQLAPAHVGKEPLNSDPNKMAKAYYVPSESPTIDMVSTYKQMTQQTLSSQKALKRSIQKLIDFKQQAPRQDLHAGRLGKKLLRVITENEHPRLFYKKQAESRDLDVTFSLLVDCSASMHDKMEETKIGITLFHESLRSLRIPHAITGFWEDALKATDSHQPNYFDEVISFETSLLPGNGPAILHLQPEEDNRDGFAIREVANGLIRRSESHKILIVFTDGEPSAFNYQDQGIVDTHEAVLEVRKRGIEVIGILLADTYTQESEKDTLKNIYGKSSLVIPSAAEIPEVLTPLLRKLLTKYIV